MPVAFGGFPSDITRRCFLARRCRLTTRQRIAQMLRERSLTARELSQALGISEKEVYEHLSHVQRSLGRHAGIIVEPARCLKCAFVFNKRSRLTIPTRCPVCRSGFISPPVYAIR
ncbi:MAG TPA: ArsR family transcriptional regulator [Desulfomonilaceae bacterium]|nr:ArsR family transcriptional regulator [Desulfomonilaceae bacterium]